MKNDLKVVVIGDGAAGSTLATRIESVQSTSSIQFLAAPVEAQEPVAAWLSKAAEHIESADWVIVAIHRSLANAKAVLLGINRLANHAVLWNSLSCATATEATAWLHGRVVYGFNHVGPQWKTIECSLPLQQSNGANGRKALQSELRHWEQLLGVEAVLIADTPGGVQARIVHTIVNEAATALKEQVCTPADLDLAMQLGVNYPDGPLHWANQMGLETVLSTMECLYRNYREDRYRPAPLLRDMAIAQLPFKVKE